MYKQDLALNNLQWLICHKTKRNHIKSYIFYIYMYKENLALNNLQYAIKPNQTKLNQVITPNLIIIMCLDTVIWFQVTNNIPWKTTATSSNYS